jgi:hypothetical protein
MTYMTLSSHRHLSNSSPVIPIAISAWKLSCNSVMLSSNLTRRYNFVILSSHHSHNVIEISYSTYSTNKAKNSAVIGNFVIAPQYYPLSTQNIKSELEEPDNLKASSALVTGVKSMLSYAVYTMSFVYRNNRNRIYDRRKRLAGISLL